MSTELPAKTEYPHPDGRCPDCLLALPHCICALIPRVETRTRVVFVRHFKERFRGSNTARIAHRALPNSSLHDFDGRGERMDTRFLAGPTTALLFPGEPTCTFFPERLIVLDGSWRQCRGMVRKIPELTRMPRIAVAPSRPRDRMRMPPHPGLMATIEAVAAALGKLEQKGTELDLLFDEHCSRMWLARGGRRPTPPTLG